MQPILRNILNLQQLLEKYKKKNKTKQNIVALPTTMNWLRMYFYPNKVQKKEARNLPLHFICIPL